jgi:hypothetical protein
MTLRLGRGDWEYRRLDTASAATFVGGSIVKFLGSRNVGEMTSGTTDTHLLGVSVHSSVASLPPGKVLIAIPAENCTVFAPAGTNAQSALSLGTAVAFVKSGNTFSAITASTVTKHAVVVGLLQDTSNVTMVELSFLADALQFYSNTTNAI